jgi:hypothetical protein
MGLEQNSLHALKTALNKIAIIVEQKTFGNYKKSYTIAKSKKKVKEDFVKLNMTFKEAMKRL